MDRVHKDPRLSEKLSQGVKKRKGNAHFWLLCTEPPACPGERHAECLLTGAFIGAGQAWLWNLVTYATELSRAHHLKHYCSSITRKGPGLTGWSGGGGGGAFFSELS